MYSDAWRGITLMTRFEEKRWQPTQQDNAKIPAVYTLRLNKSTKLREIKSTPQREVFTLRSIPLELDE
jgi:hypothetical protein